MAEISDIILTKRDNDKLGYFGDKVLFQVEDKGKVKYFESDGYPFCEKAWIKNGGGCYSLIKDLPDNIDLYTFKRNVAVPLTTDETLDTYLFHKVYAIKLGDGLIALNFKLGKVREIGGIAKAFYAKKEEFLLEKTNKQISKTKLIRDISYSIAKQTRKNLQLSTKNLNFENE